jgi:hypothetical protein
MFAKVIHALQTFVWDLNFFMVVGINFMLFIVSK